MKMIKINSDHYVLTDGEKPKEGEWGVGFAVGHNGKGRGWFMFHHDGSAKAKLNAICEGSFRVTHSTKPYERLVKDGVLPDKQSVIVVPLSFSEVMAVQGEVDVEDLGGEWAWAFHVGVNGQESYRVAKESFIAGYKDCLRDNRARVYTEADLRKAFEAGVSAEAGDKPEGYSYKLGISDVDYFIQSLQNRTEWDVEFVDGLLTLKK